VHDKTATTPPPPTVQRAESPVPRALRRYLCLDDFEATARRRLPKMLYGYISGGAETDASVRDNRRAFDEYGFVPRVLNDVSGRGQTTQLFGKTYDAPFGIPPMGSAALCAYRGDIVLTRAAAAMNLPMILSASSLITLEDVRRENPDAWYQAYLAGEPSRIEPLVDRVAAAGYDTFVVPPTCRCRRTARTTFATVFRCRSRSHRRSPGIRSRIRTGCSAPGRAR
jgi:L-lactate dehydrogenase (cytochrome)